MTANRSTAFLLALPGIRTPSRSNFVFPAVYTTNVRCDYIPHYRLTRKAEAVTLVR